VKELVVERVELCPAPIGVGAAVITGVARAGFTTTKTGLDAMMTDGDPVSVT
jgi:hypothetical protein